MQSERLCVSLLKSSKKKTVITQACCKHWRAAALRTYKPAYNAFNLSIIKTWFILEYDTHT